MSSFGGRKTLIVSLVAMILIVGALVVILYFQGILTLGPNQTTASQVPGTSEASIKSKLSWQTCSEQTVKLQVRLRPSKGTNVAWYFGSTDFKWRRIYTNNVKYEQVNGSLLVKNVTKNDEGYYYERQTQPTHMIFLKVLDCRHVEVCPSKNLTINCTAMESDNLFPQLQISRIEWFYRRGSISARLAQRGKITSRIPASLRGRVSATMRSIEIRNITKHDSGDFVCKVTFTKGNTNMNIMSVKVTELKECEEIVEGTAATASVTTELEQVPTTPADPTSVSTKQELDHSVIITERPRRQNANETIIAAVNSQSVKLASGHMAILLLYSILLLLDDVRGFHRW